MRVAPTPEVRLGHAAIEAAMLGSIVGDALGVPVEFKSRTSLRGNPVAGMRGFGTHNQPVGTWSDDSSLMLCLAESLAEKGVDYHESGGPIRCVDA